VWPVAYSAKVKFVSVFTLNQKRLKRSLPLKRKLTCLYNSDSFSYLHVIWFNCRFAVDMMNKARGSQGAKRFREEGRVPYLGHDRAKRARGL
jgi:hypothetical protein